MPTSATTTPSDHPDPSPATSAHLLAVVSASGGVGKTTMTLALAEAFAGLGQRVLVVDLDVVGGATAALTPQGAPSHALDLRMLLEDDAESAFVRSAAPTGWWETTWRHPVGHGFVDLASLDARELGEPLIGVTPNTMARAMLGTSAVYDLVLVDCPAGPTPLLASVLATATIIFLVTTTESAPLRAAERIAPLIDSAHVIVNRCPRTAVDTIANSLPPGLAERLTAVMPECPQTQRAIAKRRPLGNDAAKFVGIATRTARALPIWQA